MDEFHQLDRRSWNVIDGRVGKRKKSVVLLSYKPQMSKYWGLIPKSLTENEAFWGASNSTFVHYFCSLSPYLNLSHLTPRLDPPLHNVWKSTKMSHFYKQYIWPFAIFPNIGFFLARKWPSIFVVTFLKEIQTLCSDFFFQRRIAKLGTKCFKA